jgi:inhibitor of KinA
LAVFRAASDRALLVSFGEEVTAEAAASVARLARSLEGLRGILNLHPAYVSVLVEFDPRLRTHAEIEAQVRLYMNAPSGTDDRLSSSVSSCQGISSCPVVAVYQGTALAVPQPSGPKGFSPCRTVEIPVRYGGDFGPDLAGVARHAGISPERVVELHSSALYLVHFLGFSPGFPYLGGLPPELATPRLEVPRRLAPAGSVAIGGSHAGIYPMDSPGGWRIVGRTPLRLFDDAATPPALLAMGDHVRFVPIPEGRP